MLMNDGIDSILDKLLVGWHRWSSGYQYGRGFYGVNAACRMAQPQGKSREDASVFDDALDDDTAQAMDAAIDAVPQPHRTALAFQARNLSSGASVWTSPRLPANPNERTILVIEARNQLLRLLASRGVMS